MIYRSLDHKGVGASGHHDSDPLSACITWIYANSSGESSCHLALWERCEIEQLAIDRTPITKGPELVFDRGLYCE